ncbi:hypothetical protein [Cupriavidus sp. SS-3]|uniref:hypothetical protein n=1 Tax=Cupriavidus sp. SS-3 TaxID=3109596 RepID=UPI002DB88F3B|nr:hypothetical protein [Cupriavidus sp. SS-3]MEC3768802.1 hypothetical protein [Cupriavidus sp. SS-3]
MTAEERHQYMLEVQQTRECAEAAVALSAEQGFPFWLAWGTMPAGLGIAEQGSREEGIAQMRDGLTSYQAAGAAFGCPYFLALLAQAHANAGQANAGLGVLADPLAGASNTGERYYEAELHRLEKELLLQRFGTQPCMSSDHEAPEAFSHKAIMIARQQGAKWLELGASLSLARLWGQLGKTEAARQALVGIQGAFTEWVDTADWQQGKRLLDALSPEHDA